MQFTIFIRFPFCRVWAKWSLATARHIAILRRASGAFPASAVLPLRFRTPDSARLNSEICPAVSPPFIQDGNCDVIRTAKKLGRLFRMARILARHDALLPLEY